MAIQPLYPSTRPSLNLDFANTKTLDPRITFSRASTATYYDGKTFTKAEENLLSYSQEFDNAYWIKQSATITANATTAPDGATTADKLVATSVAGRHGAYLSVSSFVSGITYTLSVYVKSAEYTKFYISDLNGGNFYCSFDLIAVSTGTPGGYYTNRSASIVAAANGFYRCSITFTSTETANRAPDFCGYPDTGATLDQYGAQYTGDGTSGIYIWGAQLEQRSSATVYTPTTAQPITNYIPVLQTAASGIPRFDHNPTTGESLGLLIEEQRTNLLLRSQEFDDAAWVKARGSITANATVSPDGTLTADKFIADTQINPHFPYQTPSKSSGAAYTLTCFAKAGEWGSIALFSEDSTIGVGFNLLTGQYVSTIIGSPTGYSITPVGNGWYRVSMSFTSTTTAGQIAFRAGLAGDYGAAGNNYSGIYIWGAQLEAGSFPTSYIPTTTAQVTRSADAASMTGSNFSSWYRQDEGTIFIENNYNHGGTDDGKTALHVDNAAGSRFMLHNSGSLNRLVVTVNNTEVVSISGATPASKSFVKTAFAIKTNDFASSSNAANASVDTSGNVPIVSVMRLGTYESPGYELNGHIKRIAYYPSRLSNSVIQALTT